MQVFCKYCEELDKFLNEVVEYVLQIYGDELNLTRLDEIELVDKDEFAYETDGKIFEDGRKVVVTSRLYEQLPNYDIEKLENNLIFKSIIGTLHHELIHISDWCMYPDIYKHAFEMEEARKFLPALFWLEYIAEMRSFKEKSDEAVKFCEGVANGTWNAYEFNYETTKQTNFFYLLKVLPYFIVRKKYIENDESRLEIKNPLLQQFVHDLDKELIRLNQIDDLNEIQDLEPLYDIMNEYYKKFKRRYKR